MEPKIQEILHDESQSSSAASAQMVASVVDLLIEIFLRLPVKSLICFKSVSKHWQSLISDPGFTILRNPNPNPATGLILQIPLELQLFSDEMAAPYAHIVSLDGSSPWTRTLKCIDSRSHHKTAIRSCCNELLLCGRYNNREHRYYVCNPTTNTNFALPQIPDEPKWMLLRTMCLAFDPSKSPHYKVVCVLELGPDHPYRYRHQFLVYSSETGCWRKSCAEPFQAVGIDFERRVYWNGAIHWLSFCKTGNSIYFDPDDDRMSLEIMPTPPFLHYNHIPFLFCYFGESCGHLHYIDDCRNWMMDVYELRSDYSEWFVKYRIRDPCYTIDHKPFLCAVVRGKSDDDSFSVFLVEGKFVRYNFLNKTRETICKVVGAPFQQCLTSVHDNLPLLHAESLCSV